MLENELDISSEIPTEEIVDESMFLDASEFISKPEKQKEASNAEERDFSEGFSPKQIGSIAKYISPLSGYTPIDEIAEMFKKNPEMEAFPIEEYDRVIGIIDRTTAKRATDSFTKRLMAGPVSDYLLKDYIILDAKDYIEKSFAKISEVNRKYGIKFFPVFNRRSFFGIVSLDEFLERTAQIREQDMEKASMIQKSLFPTKDYIKSNFKYNINLWNKMANSLGGDCYEVFPFSDHDGMICCFDVSGKNVAASLLTVAAMSYFKMLKVHRRDSNPVKILAGLDGYLENVVPVGNFITGAIVYVDTRRKLFYVFNCGHTTIFLVYKNPNTNENMKVSAIEPKLPPFGMGQVRLELEASEKITDLRQKPYYVLAARQGVHIALYSDGFTDMMNEDGERYEEQKTKEFFINLYSKDSEDVPGIIEKEVTSFIGKAMLPDDITVIDIRFDSEEFS